MLAATALLLPAACAKEGDRRADAGPAAQSTGYHQPGEPSELSNGSLAEMSLDGSAAYVEDTDPRLSKPGCEGQPEPVTFRVPLAGGNREALGGDKAPFNGRIVRAKGQRAALVASCEEFSSGLHVGSETTDGHLTGFREVKLKRRQDEPWPSPNTFVWSVDGQHLIAAVNEITAEGKPTQLLRVDPSTGVTRPVFDVTGTTGVSHVDQLADGTYALAGEDVTLRNGTGAVTATYDGDGFALPPDRTRIAVFGRTLALVTPGAAEPATLVPREPGQKITAAAFSPDGKAIAYVSRVDNDDTLSIVTIADSKATKVFGPGRIGDPLFSADGRHLAYTELGGEGAGFVAKVMLVPLQP